MKIPVMSRGRKLHWWLYSVVGVITLLFFVPTAISAKDTVLVIIGVLTLIVYGVWSWQLWVKRLFEYVSTKAEEESKK